ncbi:PucR family transcriptional regulator [Thalassiella azotivora]
MPTVAEVVETLGPALLELVRGDGRAPVRDVALLPAPAGTEPVPTGHAVHTGDLVLCVAASDDADRVAALVTHCGRAGAAAVALDHRTATHPVVREHAEGAGVDLLAVPAGSGWAHLVWLLRSLLDHPGGAPDAPGTGFGELFTLAEALAAVLGGPVTVEDPASRVLAHSSRQEGADPARLSTIVGRRVPAELTERFRAMGVLQALQRSDEPVVVPSWGPGISPRLVIPVRAGRELLGSIWAVVDSPVPAEHVAELQRVVSSLALHLLRLRAQEDLVGRLEAERLQAALSGTAPPGWAPPGTSPWRVVCLSESAGGRAVAGGASPGHADRWRAVLRWSGWRSPRLAAVDGAVLVLVDASAAHVPGSWAWLCATTATGLVAASRPVADPDDVPTARLEAVELMSLLADGTLRAGGERPLAAAEDAWADLVVARARRAVAGGPLPPAVRQVLDHDRVHGGDWAGTLAAALAHPGDPRAAAAALHVHPNTFRYRLRRLHETVALDTSDPAVRLALQLLLPASP